MAKKHVTFNIEEDIKRDFQIEVIKNSDDMSSVIEHLMTNYIKISSKLRDAPKPQQIPEIDTESTRLELNE